MLSLEFYIILFIFGIVFVSLLLYIIFLLVKRCLLCCPDDVIDNTRNISTQEQRNSFCRNEYKVVNYNALM